MLRIGEENDREPLVYGFHFLIECCGVRIEMRVSVNGDLAVLFCFSFFHGFFWGDLAAQLQFRIEFVGLWILSMLFVLILVLL